MNKHLKFLTGSILSFSATAFAVPVNGDAPPPPPPPPHIHHCPTHEEIKKMESNHEKKLYDELKITPAQEGKWTALTKAMEANTPDFKCDVPPPVTFTEKVDFAENEAKKHHETIESLKTPALELYNSLSSEQKEVMDKAFIPGLTFPSHFGHMPPHSGHGPEMKPRPDDNPPPPMP